MKYRDGRRYRRRIKDMQRRTIAQAMYYAKQGLQIQPGARVISGTVRVYLDRDTFLKRTNYIYRLRIVDGEPEYYAKEGGIELICKEA